MSKGNPAHLFKVCLMVGLFGLLGLVGASGLAWFGWHLMSSGTSDASVPGPERSGDGTFGQGQGGGSEGDAGGLVGWLQSADEHLGTIAQARNARDQVGLDNLAGPKRPLVASQPISADARIYQQYIARDDVLVMVEYYADW